VLDVAFTIDAQIFALLTAAHLCFIQSIYRISVASQPEAESLICASVGEKKASRLPGGCCA